MRTKILPSQTGQLKDTEKDAMIENLKTKAYFHLFLFPSHKRNPCVLCVFLCKLLGATVYISIQQRASWQQMQTCHLESIIWVRNRGRGYLLALNALWTALPQWDPYALILSPRGRDGVRMTKWLLSQMFPQAYISLYLSLSFSLLLSLFHCNCLRLMLYPPLLWALR